MKKFNETKFKLKLVTSNFKYEQIVASVQDKGLPMSLPGLYKMFKGDLPKEFLQEILNVIAKKLKCKIADFYDNQNKRAA